jgi:hypothetical protein
MTMIVTWLIEIWLNQLGELREQGQEMSENYDILQDEFRLFLARGRIKVSITEDISYMCSNDSLKA